MSDMNVCTFTGRLGKDPEMHYTQDGKAICNYSIAVGSQWKKDGEKQERTSWVRVVSYGKLAEICGEYLKKAAQVAVSGRFEEREYKDKDGNDRRIWELTIDKMTMLGGKRDENSGERTTREEPAAAAKQPVKAISADEDDDVPF